MERQNDKCIKREVWVDWLRVFACLLVMVVHSSEPFYLDGYDTFILTDADLIWASAIDSAARMSVPLFVIASSYLLFPLRYSSGEFFKRRAVRILIPFVVWSVVYALCYGDPLTNLSTLLLNFNFTASHLWFVYMLVGIYILMPILSPWAKDVSKKELKVYLALWLLTTIIPLIRDIMTLGNVSFIMGPSFIPRQADYPLWGECSWNPNGTFYYISGCIGYLLAGLYFRRFVGDMKWKKVLIVSLPLLLIGFGVIEGGFVLKALSKSEGIFPIRGDWGNTIWMETTWHNETLGVALMTLGTVVLLKKIKTDGMFYQKMIVPISKASYGMYLMHLMLLPVVSNALRHVLGIGEEGLLGFMTTPTIILLTALVTFILTAFVSIVIQHIPKIGKYIVG
ncbi:MAG: acyltransferase [Bacteroidaceae bacterium]|nr:acyltransferase [Bacteroidaceae bacterium]